LLVDAYEPDANFVSARSIEVAAPPELVWAALPDLPAALRRSRWATLGGVPLWIASMIRGERGIGHHDVASRFKIDRIDEGREVVLTGRHSLADFATNFYVESIGNNRSRLTNVTRARFKTSVVGRVYLTGVHVFHNLYMDWMLRELRRQA
jgi:hypothetical protein